MTQRYRLTLVVAAFAAVLVAGCGSGTKLKPVSGTVTYKGEPLDSGSITFLYTNPPGPAGGAVITNGTFEIASPQGLEPGTYQVRISSPKGIGQRTPEQIAAGASVPAKERIPPNYNTKSTQTIEVTESGPNVFSWSIN